MRNLLVPLALALSACFTMSDAHASGEVVEAVGQFQMFPCNACTAGQLTSKSLSLGRGSHYIYDLNGNHLYLYEVECEPISGGTQCYTYTSTPDPDVVASYSSYHTSWTANGFSEAFHTDINYFSPTGQGPSDHDDGDYNAYDSIHASSFYNTLVTQLLDPSLYPAGAPRNTLIQLLDQNVPKPAGASFVVTVHFHDTSKRTFVLDIPGREMDAKQDSAIDSENNTLPESRPTGGREYNFPNSTRTPYGPHNIAVLLGVAPPDIHETYYQCDWDGSSQLTCHIVPN
jgi:hypothetical protein